MEGAMARGVQLMITLPCALVVAIIAVIIVHKMIMAEIPALFGFPILFGLSFLLFLCVWPPHPLVPAVIIVTIIATAVLFPFAESRLADLEFKEIGVERLERALLALHARPDNIAARFELSRRLYEAGFADHAIVIGQQAIASVSDVRDEVSNRSLLDGFRVDVHEVRKMVSDGRQRGMLCPCGKSLAAGQLACACGRNVVLDLAKRPTNRKKLAGKVILGLVAVASTIVGGAAIGLASTGPLKLASLGGLIAVIGVCLFALFGPGRKLNALWD